MSENDKKLLELLLKNKGEYRVFVDNDVVSVYDEESEFIGEFEKFGYNLLNDVFQFMGIDSELA